MLARRTGDAAPLAVARPVLQALGEALLCENYRKSRPDCNILTHFVFFWQSLFM